MTANIAQTTVAKSLAVGYTAVLSHNLINNFHYGFVRQAVDQTGAGNVSYVILRGLDNPGGQSQRFLRRGRSRSTTSSMTFPGPRASTHSGSGRNFRMIGNIQRFHSDFVFRCLHQRFLAQCFRHREQGHRVSIPALRSSLPTICPLSIPASTIPTTTR